MSQALCPVRSETVERVRAVAQGDRVGRRWVLPAGGVEGAPPPLLSATLDAWLKQRRRSGAPADFVGRVVDAAPALRRLAGVVDAAIVFGHVDDAVWLAEQLEQRRRLAWVRLVTWAIESPLASAEYLIRKLRAVDAKAKKLKPEAVAKHLRAFGKLTGRRLGIATPEALAARLAVDCKAFGYVEVAVAKKAFAAAKKGK